MALTQKTTAKTDAKPVPDPGPRRPDPGQPPPDLAALPAEAPELGAKIPIAAGLTASEPQVDPAASQNPPNSQPVPDKPRDEIPGDGPPYQEDFAKVPKDGAIVQLKFADGSVRPAIWRTTRRHSRQQRRWAPVGFWADPVSRYELGGTPVAWRAPEGHVYDQPGMLVGP